MYKYCLTVITVLLFSSYLNASPSDTDHPHGDQHHRQGVHVHGLAELTLVLDGNSLALELASPAANIVGFEHRAATAEQMLVVASAKTKLASAPTLFAFTGTNCEAEAEKTNVNMSALLPEGNKGENKGEEHHEEHHGGSDSGQQNSHSEIVAVYHFNCRQGAKLTAVSVALFEHFPAIEALNTRWVAHNRQGAIDLTATSRIIPIR